MSLSTTEQKYIMATTLSQNIFLNSDIIFFYTFQKIGFEGLNFSLSWNVVLNNSKATYKKKLTTLWHQGEKPIWTQDHISNFAIFSAEGKIGQGSLESRGHYID